MARELKDEIKKKNPFESPSEEAYLNLLRTHCVLMAEVEELFKAHGLSEPKYNVLRILRGARLNGEYNGRGVPSLEIGSRMVARVPDVTRLVDRLEGDGLVCRSRTEQDRRVVMVAITEKGLDLLAELDTPLKAMHDRQAKHLTTAEWRELSRLLVKARQRPDDTSND
jgi:DNA-binding MarR family transcriptional regulator